MSDTSELAVRSIGPGIEEYVLIHPVPTHRRIIELLSAACVALAVCWAVFCTVRARSPVSFSTNWLGILPLLLFVLHGQSCVVEGEVVPFLDYFHTCYFYTRIFAGGERAWCSKTEDF